MARVPMVTRTLSTQKVVCLVANVDDRQLTEVTYYLPRALKRKTQLVKAMTAMAEENGYKFCDIVSVDTVVQKYGMTEKEFMQNAHEIN